MLDGIWDAAPMLFGPDPGLFSERCSRRQMSEHRAAVTPRWDAARAVYRQTSPRERGVLVVMAEDSEWVVESIVGYLGSPEWLIPLTDFLENKCSGNSSWALYPDTELFISFKNVWLLSLGSVRFGLSLVSSQLFSRWGLKNNSRKQLAWS